MTSRHVRALAAGLVELLPDLPKPWDVDVLCHRLSDARRRHLTVHATDLPALPSGFWYDDGACDRIFYRASAVGYHRDHIILHEICHMLAGHGASLQGLVDKARIDDTSRPRESTGFQSRSSLEEELAETFACMVLNATAQSRSPELSVVEHRAEELFGVGYA